MQSRPFFRLVTLVLPVLSASLANYYAAPKSPEPEDGVVNGGVFEDEYFGLHYRLPTGWEEDLKGPEHAATGYYSLAALKPQGELNATIQISAQDNFFAVAPIQNAARPVFSVQ